MAGTANRRSRNGSGSRNVTGLAKATGGRLGTTTSIRKGRSDSTMTARPRFRHTRRALLAPPSPARAATQEPCDIYAAASTPCVAAHSTTRALYAAYDGPLYQVERASDGTTTNVYPLTAGGDANSAT